MFCQDMEVRLTAASPLPDFPLLRLFRTENLSEEKELEGPVFLNRSLSDP